MLSEHDAWHHLQESASARLVPPAPAGPAQATPVEAVKEVVEAVKELARARARSRNRGPPTVKVLSTAATSPSLRSLPRDVPRQVLLRVVVRRLQTPLRRWSFERGELGLVRGNLISEAEIGVGLVGPAQLHQYLGSHEASSPNLRSG